MPCGLRFEKLLWSKGVSLVAGIDEAAPKQLFQQGIDARPRKNDARVVPAQLEGDALQRMRRTFHDLLAGRNRARKHDLVQGLVHASRLRESAGRRSMLHLT